MARRTIRCGCGADFPIPEVPPSILHCPRCGDAVRFRAAGDTGEVNVQEDIREPIRPLPPRNPYYPLILLGAGGLVVAAGLVVLIIYFSGREAPLPPAALEGVKARPRVKIDPPVLSIREIPPTPEPSKAPAEPPPFKLAPPPESFDVSEALGKAQRHVARLNLAGIVQVLYQIAATDTRELEALMAKDAEELAKIKEKFSERPELSAIKEHFRPGDALIGFAGASLDARRPRAFADAIRDWLGTAQPGSTVVAVLRRGERTIPVSMWFADFAPDLLPLEFRRLPPPIVPPPPAVNPIPGDVISDVRRRIAALHPYYKQGLPAEDTARMESILKAGRGTPEDLDFLRNRVLAWCSKCESEHASFDAKVAALETSIASAQTIDTVVFKDGRRIQGQVEEETDDFVRLKGRFGAMKTPKTEVLRVERGDAFNAEFRKRYDAARTKPAELPGLLAWCKEKNLATHRELTAYAMLKADPGSDAAWTALGVADRVSAPGGPEFDVVFLKDGTKREGILTSETETAVHLDIIVRGSKGETMGTGKATLARADIAKIERMSDAARKKAASRAASFGDRAHKAQEAMLRIAVAPDVIAGIAGHRASGTLFELHSTLPVAQVRETAHTLEEMFNAYRRHFAIRRNASKKIDVYFLANSNEYAHFQQVSRGAVALNPAYFDTRANHIAAFYGVQKDEEARIRANILSSERDIEAYKKQISAEEDRITKQFRALRQDVMDEAAAARKAAGEDGKALAAVDRMKQEALNKIKGYERGAMDELYKLRTRANQAITELETVIRHNQAVLVAQTKAMYEILFHESFHAFAANFLWEEADNAGLPRWLHEGMATYFERSVVEAGDLIHGGVHPAFHALLKVQNQNNLLIPVATVVAAGADMFQIQHTGEIPRQETAYAHAWGLAHYLITRGMTREKLEAYVAEVSAGKDRLAAFERLAGKRIADVEAEWRVHINSLR